MDNEWIPKDSKLAKKVIALAKRERLYVWYLEEAPRKINTKYMKCRCDQFLRIFWTGREENKGCFLPRQSRNHLKRCPRYKVVTDAIVAQKDIRKYIEENDD